MGVSINVPDSAKESASSFFWLDEDGILNIFNKPVDVHSLENAQDNTAITREFYNDSPILLLIDVTKMRSMTREAREEYKREGSTGNVGAVAMVTKSVTGRILANFFMGFNQPDAPTKLFNDSDAARKWLISMKNG